MQLKRERIKILERQLEREESHEFYACVNKCIRLTIENAMEHNFTCFECGQLLNPEDKAKNVQKIKLHIEEAKKELAELEKQPLVKETKLKEENSKWKKPNKHKKKHLPLQHFKNKKKK